MERNQRIRPTSTDAVLKREVSEEQEQFEQGDEDSRPMSKRRRLLMKQRVDTPADDAIRAEINLYLQVKSSDIDDDDPLAFWNEAKDFDNLKQLAMVILTRSASSIQVECTYVFNHGLNSQRKAITTQCTLRRCFVVYS
jgi:hypothetical protein